MMRVLLDTNILIHREASTVVPQDIGQLFFWLDKLKNEKCVHPPLVWTRSASTVTGECASRSPLDLAETFGIRPPQSFVYI